MGLTGEIRRAFFKHRVFSELWVVEIDETGLVLAALNISSTAASACRHGLPDYELTMEAAAAVNEHASDYEVFEPVCIDATHQLRDIFDADRLSEQAFGAWQTADNHSKALKKTYTSSMLRPRRSSARTIASRANCRCSRALRRSPRFRALTSI